MKVLIANVGSTSLKYGLYEMPSEQLLSRGRIERVGETVSPCSIWTPESEKSEEHSLADFSAAIDVSETINSGMRNFFMGMLLGCNSKDGCQTKKLHRI